MTAQKIIWIVCCVLAVLSIFVALPGSPIIWAAIAIAVK